LHYIDHESDEIIPVEVFVTILGCSYKVYAVASLDQQLVSFLHSLENSLHFYGSGKYSLFIGSLLLLS